MEKFISLKKTNDFGRVYQRGKSYGNNVLVIYAYRRGQNQLGRVGVSVSKKVGNSVVRHRVKRRIKECFRTHLEWWKDGFDIVVVARQASSEADFDTLSNSLVQTGKHLDICDLDI